MKQSISVLVLFLAGFSSQAATPPSEALNWVSQQVKAGVTPIAVFDLDETLVLSHARKALSYQRILSELEDDYPEETLRAREIGPELMLSLKNGYDEKELFRSLGIEEPNFIQTASSSMLPVYLSSPFVEYDSPLPCAVEFVRTLRQKGAIIAFVSARYDSAHRAVTEKSLFRLRFTDTPHPELLFLRKDGESSITFKERSFRDIREMAAHQSQRTAPLLGFENEPENLQAMQHAFPDARLYFIEGAFLKSGPVPPKAQSMRDYCE